MLRSSSAVASLAEINPSHWGRENEGIFELRNPRQHALVRNPSRSRQNPVQKTKGPIPVQALVKGTQGRQQQPLGHRHRRHLPPFTVTLDPRQIDERQVAKLMELTVYSPYAFTSHRKRVWQDHFPVPSTHDTCQNRDAEGPEQDLQLPRQGQLLEVGGERDAQIGIFPRRAPRIQEEGSSFHQSFETSSSQPFQHSPGHHHSRILPALQLKKLRRAIDHSTVVVGLLIKRKALDLDYMSDDDLFREESGSGSESEGLFRMIPRGSNEMRLVAFARASSDASLTASVHDVVVHPDYQRLGLGRRVVQRMLRELQRYGIGDIALLCKPELCQCFGAVGFASDRMRTTTMMYTRESTGGHSMLFEGGQQGDTQGMPWIPWGSKILEVSSEDLLPPAKRQSLADMLRRGDVRAEGPASQQRLLVRLST